MGQWQKVFFIAAGVYIACATFYNLFGSGNRQAWDNPLNDEPETNGTATHQTNGLNTIQTNATNTAVFAPEILQQTLNGQTQLNGNSVRESMQ